MSKEETTNDLGSVRSHAFIESGKEHLFFALSCNLLGLFEASHITFTLDKVWGRKYWLKKESIPNISDIVYNLADSACPIYLKVERIHKQPFHYNKKKHDGKIQNFIGHCLAVHMPLEANYWHFEIHVHEQDNNRIGLNDKDWKKEAARHFLESYLKLHLGVEVESREALESSLYED